jgi:hypothetical protein
MIQELVSKLKDLKVNVQLVDGKLDLEAPRGVLSKELLNEIRFHKEDLIAFITTYRSGNAGYAAIPRVAVAESYPATASQRALWVLSQQEEGNAAYNMPGVYVFEGKLDRAAFAHAFDTLLGRHESLRTVFRADDDGEVRQVVVPARDLGFAVAYRDVRSEPDRDATVGRLVRENALRPFDLGKGPLLRAVLYHVKNDQWVFNYVLHHIISDGWSMDLLIGEVLTMYNAFTRGEVPALPPLRLQYRDYAAWVQGQLSGDALRGHRDYWLGHLAGELPVLELPADFPRPRLKTYNGAAVDLRLSAGVREGLSALCQDQGCTLFMGLLAAVNALLYRYTGQKTSSSARPLPGGATPTWKTRSGFTPTRWPCAPRSAAKIPSGTSSRKCGRSRWGRTSTRYIPSSNWWRRCGPGAT